MLTRSPTAALVSLAVLCVLSLGLGLGLGVGLKTSAASRCEELASAIATLLDARLKDKEGFAQALAQAGMPRLVLVDASPAKVNEAACEDAAKVIVRVPVTLDGAIDSIPSSHADQEALRGAFAEATGLPKSAVSLSITAGSINIDLLVRFFGSDIYDPATQGVPEPFQSELIAFDEYIRVGLMYNWLALCTICG